MSHHILGVAGNPIAHSMSPDIHSAFAQAQGDLIDYQRYLFSTQDFAHHAFNFFQQGGFGLNVTVPFKRDAYDFAHRLDGLASAPGAVNTLKMLDGEIVGYNTDGVGLINDLQLRHAVGLDGKKGLILGAGGACQGIIRPLLDAGVAQILIANRTLNKAQSIVERFQSSQQSRMRALDMTQLRISTPDADLVINSTAIGLDENALESLENFSSELVKGRVCYDLSYGKQAQFAQWAGQNGSTKSLDGLGMLVEQAAESYSIWLGERPQTSEIYRRLRDVVT